jgi:hypothetical protein
MGLNVAVVLSFQHTLVIDGSIAGMILAISSIVGSLNGPMAQLIGICSK